MHCSEKCENCHQDLQHIQGEVKERSQVRDLPELRLEVEEHQVVEICCPHCQARNQGCFPPTVRDGAQYGSRVQALAVYLSHFQLLPMVRVCETLSDLCHCGLSEGTLLNWIDQAARTLEPTQQRIKTLLVQSEPLHADETGVRIKRSEDAQSPAKDFGDVPLHRRSHCLLYHSQLLEYYAKTGRSMLVALTTLFFRIPRSHRTGSWVVREKEAMTIMSADTPWGECLCKATS